MKKISIIAGLLFAGIVSAQQKGSIGVNAEPNGATLQVNISSASDLDKTKGQGLAVPNVTKATLSAMTGTIATSAMVYVIGDSTNTDTNFADTTTNINRTNMVTGLGYYYFNGTQWVQLGGATPEGTFTRNIRKDNRTTVVVDQLQDGSTSVKDYFIHMTGNPTNITLPSAASNTGREVCFYNPGTNTATVSPIALGIAADVVASATTCFISDGTNWINSKGY